MKAFAQHYYRYLQANYYVTAKHPHPIQRIAILAFAISFFLIFLIAITFTDVFRNQDTFFTPSNIIFLFFGLFIVNGISTIIASIQGYLHKHKINDTDIPNDLPPSGVTKRQIVLALSLFAIYNLFILLYKYLV